MTGLEKINELKFIIGRYDHYYDTINNKGNLYLTINTFMLGGILAGFTTLNATHHFDLWVALAFLVDRRTFYLVFTKF